MSRIALLAGAVALSASCDEAAPLPALCAEEVPPTLEGVRSFLMARCYEDPRWARDPEVRPTGPTIEGTDYSVHGDVRVYYSPTVVEWLRAGRPDSGLADGSFMVKEQYTTPSPGPEPVLEGWTIMLKDRSLSHDGWLWGYIDRNDADYDVAEPFLQYCIACHASADNAELTFASLENIEGRFIDYGALTDFRLTQSHDRHDPDYGDARERQAEALPEPLTDPSPAFVAQFDDIAPVDRSGVRAFPPRSHDHVPPSADDAGRFVTSDVCAGCHDADSLLHNATPHMLVEHEGEQLNVSPYGEWSASMMGLAGRDPVFYAQLETERALHPEIADSIDHLCLSCHGVTGRRQFVQDNGPDARFTYEMVYATGDDPNAEYAALARDGISCEACHRMSDENLGSEASFTGGFELGPPGEIYGPFANPSTYSMENGLGMTPVHATHISESAACGSCHVVEPPVLDADTVYDDDTLGAASSTHEQTTYLEWRNSIYQDERAPSDPATAASCQSCHMASELGDDAPLSFTIANIQDATYPPYHGVADDALITLEERSPFARHRLLGVNLYVMAMFRQFPDVLGVSFTDENISSNERPIPNLFFARDNALQNANERTATVGIEDVQRTATDLEVTVRVVNRAGHKLPSGVGFRRAFLELVVLDADDAVLWGSGRTNELGVIVDGAGVPLPTELGGEDYEPHHAVITDQRQAQIYESRHRNSRGELTTSFLALSEEVKDNRLLPQGWRADGPHADVTEPIGIDADPAYADGSGSDRVTYRIPRAAVEGAATVRATLHYQSIPPYYLEERFRASQGPATRRLHYLASHLAVEGTEIDGWTLRMVQTERALP